MRGFVFYHWSGYHSFMKDEMHPEVSKTDEACFEEIRGLLAEGWRFRGNIFEKDQTYRLVVSKEGEEEKVFHTTRPYPKSVDAAGNIMGTISFYRHSRRAMRKPITVSRRAW